jgi:hypothetical protein
MVMVSLWGLVLGPSRTQRPPASASLPLTILKIAKVIDVIRLIPRVCLIGYGVLVYHVVNWGMGLPDLSVGQAGFVSTVIGVIPFLLNFYMQNKRDWSKDDSPVTDIPKS